MLWKHANIEARIWPNDHCPPHVTFVCRADVWTARMAFSMVDSTVSLIDVKPLKNAPSLALLDLLAHQLADHQQLCRDVWWRLQATVCLDNKRVVRCGPTAVKLGMGAKPVGTVVAGSGVYAAGKVSATVIWPTGVITRDVVEG